MAKKKNNIDLSNKICLITGATSGIGRATALALAQMGAVIVFNTRNEERGLATRDWLIKKTGNQRIFPHPCDLSDLASVNSFADTFANVYPNIDILINNAGVFEYSKKKSADNIENTFAVNHLAHFLLTYKLLPMIKQNKGCRIINVSSDMHRRSPIMFNDLQFDDNKYSAVKAYAQSKTANILFTKSLAIRLNNSNVVANAVHPGVVATKIARSLGFLGVLYNAFVGKSPQRGAKTNVYLASQPEAANITGQYLHNKKIVQPAQHAIDMLAAEKLWHVSEQMCGLIAE